MSSEATFGWEISDLVDGYGADVQAEWTNGTVDLTIVHVDVSAVTTAPPTSTGWCEMLTQVVLSSNPTYSGNPAYIVLPADGNFGSVTMGDNPGNLGLVHDGTLRGPALASIILKWPLLNGRVTADHRSVQIKLPGTFQISNGSYLIAHMDYYASISGVQVDAAMQLVIEYG